MTVTQNGVFLVLVLLVARRMGLQNTTGPRPWSRRRPVGGDDRLNAG